jgi:opacity protein-like surface antigen
MSKYYLAPVIAVSALSFCRLAAGQTAPAGHSGSAASGGSSCPPGSWFCAQAPQQQAAPAGQPVEPLETLPDPEAPSAPSPAPPPPRHRAHSAPAEPTEPPPPVEYEPPPIGELERTESPPPYEYGPPPPPHHLARPEWGLNLHLEGATIGHGGAGGGSMGGFGTGLRFKPTRYFGVEGDLDFVGGHDYNDNNRNETAFTLNALAFLNPQSVVQVYLLAGFGWSGAHVTNGAGLDAGYGYFGAQAGAGLEFRLSRVLALNADFRGFIRGRTDHGAETQPEFVDAYGRSTNTSGGGLFTGGMTLYF